MRKSRMVLVTLSILLLILVPFAKSVPTELANATQVTLTEEELIAKVKSEVMAEIKASAKPSLKNAVKFKYKLVDDSRDRVYTVMYFRDLNARHNIGFGYEYTHSTLDKHAFLVEYTYKF